MTHAEKDWNKMFQSTKVPNEQRLQRFVTKHRSILSALELSPAEVTTEARRKRIGVVCIRLNSPATDSFWSIFQHKKDICFSGEVYDYADWEPIMDILKQFGAIKTTYRCKD